MRAASWRKGKTLREQSGIEKAAQAERRANTLDAVAAELVDKQKRDGKSPVTAKKFQWLLGFAPPAIGARPLAISARAANAR